MVAASSMTLFKPHKKKPKKKVRKARPPVQKRLRFDRREYDIALQCINPFDHSSDGCRLMYGSSSKTFSYAVRGRIGAGRFSTGDGARWVHPGITDCIAGPSSITADVVSWAAASDITEAASLTPLAKNFRVVCAGIRVFTNVPYDADGTGLIQVAAVPGASSPTGYKTTSTAYEYVDDGPMYGFDRTYLFPRESPGAVSKFSTTDDPHLGWQGMVVSWTGMEQTARSNVVFIDYVWHLELEPEILSVGARLAEKPAPAMPKIANAVVNAVRDAPFGVQTESWTDTAKQLATTALVSGAEMLAASIML